MKGTHYEMVGPEESIFFKRSGVSFPQNMDDFQLSHRIESERILKEYFTEV